jgi:DNA-binding CsgD family transcriptional regulator
VLGARPRRLAFSGVDSLTASERRIAEMAAGGMTNRLISEELFLTRKTIEKHLTNVYRKLDVSSRAELPVALSGDRRP